MATYLAPLMKQSDTQYLLKITSTQNLPSRADVVAWCAKNGLAIKADKIYKRNDVLRVEASSGELKFKPSHPVLQALRDTTAESLLIEPGDQIRYVSAGLHSTGLVHSIDYGNSQACIKNDITGSLDVIALNDGILSVSGSKLDEARASDPTDFVRSQLGL